MPKAREWTDAELARLERAISAEYARAAGEMRKKHKAHMREFAKEKERREKALDGTDEARQKYEQWLKAQAARAGWMERMAVELSEVANSANVKAAELVNNALPRIFAENANRAAFGIDSTIGIDTGFTLVNEDAVRYLLGLQLKDEQLVREAASAAQALGSGPVKTVRKRRVDDARDMRWNRQKFTSALTQGILQGESVDKIARRVQSVCGMNEVAAVRAARTATTNAENAGRMSSFERAQSLGIDVEVEWVATLDTRTRDSHAALDGERVGPGETFSNGLRWPGDADGDPAEVWNCRCRASSRVVGFDGKCGKWADIEQGERWSNLPKGVTYAQWKDRRRNA